MSRPPLALVLVLALPALTASPASADLVTAFDYGTVYVSRQGSFTGPLTSSYGQGSLVASGGDLREGIGTFDSAAAKFNLGTAPITSAFLTIDVILTQGTAGYSGNIPLTISAFAADATPIGLVDFLEPVTTGPTLTLPSTLGNDGTTQHFYTIDVTSLLRSLSFNDGSTVVELRFTDPVSNSNVAISPYFFPNSSGVPTLTINAPLASVPEPASAALAMVGVGLVVAGCGTVGRSPWRIAADRRAG